MEQAKALNALEPFLALTSSATSPRAAADLVMRSTSAPNTYIFTELLQTPQIQALASSPEFSKYLTLLQIFSYGTYQSYKSTQGLPELTEAQQLKLRQLSLLTIASQKNDPSFAAEPALSYASLQRALDLPSRQALEQLVISAIYAGLLKAQLNPKDSLVQINSVSSLRDVAPIAIGGLLSSLQAWSDRCDATLSSLSAQMVQLRADADRRAAQSAAWNEKMEKLVEDEKKGSGGGGSGSGKGQGPPQSSSSSAPFSSSLSSFTSSSSHHHHHHHHNHHKTAHRPASAKSPTHARNPSGLHQNSILTNTGDSSGVSQKWTLGGGVPSSSSSGPLGGSSTALPTSLMNATQALKRDSGQMDADDDDKDDNDHAKRKTNHGSKTATTLSQQTTQMDLGGDGGIKKTG